MTLFLLATFVYRLANGLLFLAVAWNLVRSADGGAMPLALSAIGGFLPAVVAAPFARRLLGRVDTRKLTLWGIAGLCLCALLFTPFLHMSSALLIVNFLVLSLFFLLEGAWDALLAAIVKRLPPIEGDKLNSRQSAVTQGGLMLGGLPIGLLIRYGGSEAPFLAAAVLYIVTLLLFMLPVLRDVSRNGKRDDSIEKVSQPEVDIDQGSASPAWATVAALALVWPCLTLVNMAVPLVANSEGKGTVEHAALIDASIGLGMACIGLLYERLIRYPARFQMSVLVAASLFMPIPFVMLLTMPYWLPGLCITFFVCGIGFGLLRVSLRRQLIATQPAYRVGQIVASCNAYGFPVLATLALLYARSWNLGPWVPLAAFLSAAVMGILALSGKRAGTRTRSASPDVG